MKTFAALLLCAALVGTVAADFDISEEPVLNIPRRGRALQQAPPGYGPPIVIPEVAPLPQPSYNPEVSASVSADVEVNLGNRQLDCDPATLTSLGNGICSAAISRAAGAGGNTDSLACTATVTCNGGSVSISTNIVVVAQTEQDTQSAQYQALRDAVSAELADPTALAEIINEAGIPAESR
jgi:hypothetical protein